MVQTEKKQFIIDGEPKLILAGEIHYFRLKKSEWQDRLTKLKEAGFNTVSTYIPWICHEEQEGMFDFDGHTREELDLIGFLELCKENDLYLIARPGPFVMAELKNEGIPHWVAKNNPVLRPVTWDGREADNTTLDYLAPEFLACVKKWYAQVMGVIRPYLQPADGNIIAVQLDNEIGMISWCGNKPDLTECVLKDFGSYLKRQYSEEELYERYPFFGEAFAKGIRSPGEEYALKLHKDLGFFMRQRSKEYVKILTEYAKENGIAGVPFFINVHGTAGGRGMTFPIGISQLQEAYTMSDEYLPGTDLYLGNLTMDNFADLYILNAYMDAANRDAQPLASMEFECGYGYFEETFEGRMDMPSMEFKTRMCIAQGYKLLNCYMFCGGYNYRLREDVRDGNNRIAFTGERHGFAMPVDPEGRLNYSYPGLAQVMKLMAVNEEKLAGMQEEHDNVVLGFLPDYYMTEFHYPGSERETALCRELEQFRGYGLYSRLGCGMLLNGYRFRALDLQKKAIDAKAVPTLVVCSASHMAAEIQKKLADYVTAGGSLLLYGRVPQYDMEGNPCTILKELLEIDTMSFAEGSGKYFLSVAAASEGLLAPGAEVLVPCAETYEVRNCQPVLLQADTGAPCSFFKKAGSGKVLVLGTLYICHLENIRKMLEALGCVPALTHDQEYHGLFLTMMKNEAQEKFLHILNLDSFAKESGITYQGKKLFEGKRLMLGSRQGLMLPLDLETEGIRILYATGEIIAHKENEITFRLTQQEDVICIAGTGAVLPGSGYTVKEKNGNTYVISNVDGRTGCSLQLKLM